MIRYLPVVLSLSLFAPVAWAQDRVVQVLVKPLSEVTVDLERRAPGEVVALNDSLLAAEVNAVVATVLTDVGQKVMTGDLLLELDQRDFQLQLDAAEAALASARARSEEAKVKLERARSLDQSQYVSKDELLTRETAMSVATADIRNAEAQVAIARRQFEKCRILSPFDGVVTERFAQQGSYVNVSSPLLRVTQTQPVELDVEVPASLADTLLEAESMRFVVTSREWPVELLRLSPVVEAGRRARKARLGFPGTAPSVGQSGTLVWRLEGGQLPANLVSRREGRLGVFIERDGSAEFLELSGAEEGRPVAISLPGGTLVVVQGQDRLQHGDKVERR